MSVVDNLVERNLTLFTVTIHDGYGGEVYNFLKSDEAEQFAAIARESIGVNCVTTSTSDVFTVKEHVVVTCFVGINQFSKRVDWMRFCEQRELADKNVFTVTDDGSLFPPNKLEAVVDSTGVLHVVVNVTLHTPRGCVSVNDLVRSIIDRAAERIVGMLVGV